MAYVMRDAQGKVVGETLWPMDGVPIEKLADDHPDLIEFQQTRRIPPTPAEKLIDSFELITSDAISDAKNFDELRIAVAAFADDLKAAMVGYLNLIKG